MTGEGEGKEGNSSPLPLPLPPFFFAPALTFAQWLDWKRLLRRLVFARSHAHENAKTMEMRYHPLQGMGCIIYEIIIFVLSYKNDQPAFSKNTAPGTVFENLSFCCPKTPFTCGRKAKTEEKICDFKNVRIHEGWALSWYHFFSCDCPFNVIAKHTLLCLFSFCSLSCINCFFVILTSFFINFLLPRVLQIEIHNKLLITLYSMPSKRCWRPFI